MNKTNCFECGSEKDIQMHHPVPRSRGGTMVIPLCSDCHNLAHHRKRNMNINTLTKEALKAKKERGEYVGRPPYGFTINGKGKFEITDMFYAVHKVLRMKERGKRQREIVAKMKELYPEESWNQSKISKLIKRWKSVYRLHLYRMQACKIIIE